MVICLNMRRCIALLSISLLNLPSIIVAQKATGGSTDHHSRVIFLLDLVGSGKIGEPALPGHVPQRTAFRGDLCEAHKIHKEEFREEFHKECELFAKERDRYISEYHDTKAILADMNEQSQQETLDIDKSQERGI